MRRGAPPGGRALMYISALAGVVAMVGMWNFLSSRKVEALPGQHLLAVGNFDTQGNHSAGPGTELQAELLHQLAEYPAIQVVDPAREETSPQAGIDFLLDGSLQESPPGWELTVRLRDLDENRVLWSDAFPLASADLDSAGERVVEGLARTLKVHPR